MTRATKIHLAFFGLTAVIVGIGVVLCTVRLDPCSFLCVLGLFAPFGIAWGFVRGYWTHLVVHGSQEGETDDEEWARDRQMAESLHWEKWRLTDDRFSCKLTHLPTGLSVYREYEIDTPLSSLWQGMRSELRSKIAGAEESRIDPP
jgi:hypothetical protein